MITSYRIEGMHCSSCIEKIKQALSKYVQVNAITLNPPVLQIESDNQPNITRFSTVQLYSFYT